jgi:TetR/AcrR family transcriptional repressor of nem operon
LRTVAAGKSEKLVEAASRVIHERGSSATTLAAVAAESDVPLGNVYYYFKTKDELVAAVVESRLEELRRFLALADEKTTPVERLCVVLDGFASRADDIVRRGCPYGSLASELEKNERDEGAGSPARAGRLFALQLEWMEAQFRALRVGGAKARAAELLCAIQGACLVAHALHDPLLFERRLADLARQLRTERQPR